jgi:hypothetical protein
MQKNFIDLKLFQFSKYLNDIGILSRANTEQFQKYFYELANDIYQSKDISSNDVNINFIYLKKCIVSALINYIQSLSEEEQKLLALNIYDKYDKKENKLYEKLIRILEIYSRNKVKSYFDKWKSEIIILTNSLKKTISENILLNIQKSLESKIIQNYQGKNITNENKINSHRNNSSNNSMLNINPHLNISTNPDMLNNNYNNYSYHDMSMDNNINYTYENKNKRNTSNESSKTYSINYYIPSNNNNYINSNYHNDSYNYIQNYLNKKKYNPIPKSLQRYTGNNSALINYKNNSINNLSHSKIKKSKVNLDYINNLSKSKTEHNLILEKTTEYKKEQEEINNFCTFKPKINKSSSFSHYWNSTNKRTIDDRLYLDSKNRIARKEFESLKKNNMESKENSFQPKFISSSVKKVKSDFDKRLKEFEINKKNKIKKLSEEIEEEKKQQFTFTPKINQINYNNKRNNIMLNNNNNYTITNNLSKNSTLNHSAISKNNTNKKIPAYKRLYNENKNKLIRQEQRQKEELDKIKKNSSKISEGSNNNNLLDKRKIEELYNDYKYKKNRLKMKQEEIEKEQGITFHPELISDKNYYNRINPDFYEREKIFLEKQQKNIEIYKQYLENENNKKKYSDEEKKEIYDNIVNKLYKDGMEKYREKQGKNNFKNTMDDFSENDRNNNAFFKNSFTGNESEISSKKIY